MKQAVPKLSLIGLIFIFLSLPVFAQISLPSIVSDGMILQRDQTVKIWGWAASGEKVMVRFRNKSYRTTAGNEGKWQIQLDPMPAGGPYDMVLKASNKITIQNILIGDVWVCSGQSNMTHQFNRWQERYAKEIAEANNPEIRQFYVPTKAVLTGPIDDIPGLKWEEANSEKVLNFTVVGYFFAKKLFEQYHVPQAIIMTCVGGTPIEAWISEEGFKEFPDILATVIQNQDTAYVNGLARQAWSSMRSTNDESKPKVETDKGLSGPIKWYDSAYQPLNWKRIGIPGYWEDQGIHNLDGVVWFRREIYVPEAMTGAEAMVKLGRIVNADELYINGEKVGNTTYEYPQREYKIGANVLKPGKNLFVIKVTNNGGKGGFVPDKPYLLLAAGDTIDLKGYWQYKVGEVAQRRNFKSDGAPMVRPISAQNSPTGLYNGMIAPVINYAVRGFLWYQGESNAGNPEAYGKLLPAIIKDWRSHWQLGDLTFLIAQLPNYMDVNYSPEESNWAEIRETQLETALNTSNTGVGINIDLGEWNDIHPGNKKPVGERLALSAMRISYGDTQTVTSGPIFKSYRIENNKVILTFDGIGTGLTVNNGEDLAHFAIAGNDQKFVWAHAEIKNNEVVVWNEDIAKPKYIRYAWADNPDFANLCNEEGLPASPFRIAIK
ncbi:MAG: sialate O-acetylesterase [Prolixibacteraceae bacterium]